jgi:Ser/Thr protein kinase RdoA (MazF antagonist)
LTDLWDKGESVYSPSEMEIFRATAERAWQDLQALGEDRNVFGLIHRDLHPWNFVFHNGAVYIIDFDSCGWGYYLYDMAVTLVELDFSQEDYGAPCAQMQAAFLKGYQRVRPLPVGYQEYIGTFMAIEMVRIVNMVLGWKAPTEKPWGPRYLATVVERLGEFAAGNDINPKPVVPRLLLWLKTRSPLDLVGRRSW